MNGYLFALIQVLFFFTVAAIYCAYHSEVISRTEVVAGLVYFLGICQGVFYMGRKGGGKV